MKLKSYFSGTVEAAIELARNELGEEALLVNARPATPEARYLGDYEVVFGVHEHAAAAVTPPRRGGDRLADEVAELKREFERITQTLRDSVPQSRAPAGDLVPFRNADDSLRSRLIAQELAVDLIDLVVSGRDLASQFETDSNLGVDGSACRIAVFVGPPGGGKTTSLLKVAAHFGVAQGRSTHIISTDVYRIGAAAQLQTLASILNIGCSIAETAGDLAALLSGHRSKDLLLVDTPGLGPNEMDNATELVRFIQHQPDLDTHLVLPAYLRAIDMSRAIDSYSCFSPKKLLFTRLDETSCYGPLVSESANRGLPISFLCTGQRIPDDFEPASREKLAPLVLGDHATPAEPPLLARGAAA